MLATPCLKIERYSFHLVILQRKLLLLKVALCSHSTISNYITSEQMFSKMLANELLRCMKIQEEITIQA